MVLLTGTGFETLQIIAHETSLLQIVYHLGNDMLTRPFSSNNWIRGPSPLIIGYDYETETRYYSIEVTLYLLSS